jgi:hypothetical protein
VTASGAVGRFANHQQNLLLPISGNNAAIGFTRRSGLSSIPESFSRLPERSPIQSPPYDWDQSLDLTLNEGRFDELIGSLLLRMSTFEEKIAYPKCSSLKINLSQRIGTFDWFFRTLGRKPYRRRFCGMRVFSSLKRHPQRAG